MRVLVCGGRNFGSHEKYHAKDWGLMCAILDELHEKQPITAIIHNAYRGADRMAGEWAALHGVAVIVEHVDWGSAWQPARHTVRTHNRLMLEHNPDLCLAFGARGTVDMLTQAMALGVPVRLVNESGE